MGDMEIIDQVATLAGFFALAFGLVLVACIFFVAFGRILYDALDSIGD